MSLCGWMSWRIEVAATTFGCTTGGQRGQVTLVYSLSTRVQSRVFGPGTQWRYRESLCVRTLKRKTNRLTLLPFSTSLAPFAYFPYPPSLPKRGFRLGSFPCCLLLCPKRLFRLVSSPFCLPLRPKRHCHAALFPFQFLLRRTSPRVVNRSLFAIRISLDIGSFHHLSHLGRPSDATYLPCVLTRFNLAGQ